MIETKESSCIICGRNEKDPLFSKDGFQAVKCPWCGLVYSFPRKPSPLKSIYNEEYYHSQDPFFGYLDYESYEHLFKKTFFRRLTEIERRVAKGRLLDVGCALGFFLEVAKERGWDAYGVEVSSYAVSYAQNCGLNVFEGTLEEVEFPRGFFRVATIWDLFEGLEDPMSTLVSVREVLRDDGILVIGTPNAESLASRLLRKNWAHFKPKENKFYFSPQNISSILGKAGFEVVAVSSREGGQYCDLRFISQKLKPLSLPVSRAVGFLSRSSLLGRMSFYLNTFDRMVVYASKRRIQEIDES